MAEQKSEEFSIDNMLADLDAQFGKKKKGKNADPDQERKDRNRQFHANNPSLELSRGKGPEADMSGQWKPIAKVTYVIRQTCMCCNGTVEFIGGEYVMFESKRQHARILRGAEKCPNLFLYQEDGEPLEDLVDEFNQLVSRCPGCIAVERQALQIWHTAIKAEEKKVAPELDLDIKIEGI